MRLQNIFFLIIAASTLPLSTCAVWATHGSDQAVAPLTTVFAIRDWNKFLIQPPVKALIKKTMGAAAYSSFWLITRTNFEEEVKFSGSERFVKTATPHNAPEGAFVSIDLSNSRCIAAVTDDGEVSIYGATSKAELPDSVKHYLAENAENDPTFPLHLHFLKTGQTPVVSSAAPPPNVASKAYNKSTI